MKKLILAALPIFLAVLPAMATGQEDRPRTPWRLSCNPVTNDQIETQEYRTS